jgi:hypothetical protein
MPSKFPHGAAWWAAVTSAVVMAVIAAAFGKTVWRYEAAQASDDTAETALNTARIAGQALQAGGLAETGQAAGVAAWPGPGGGRPAAGNGHVLTTVATPAASAAGVADPGGAR